MGDALLQTARERFELGPHVVELIEQNVLCIRWGRTIISETMKQVIDFVESRCIASEPVFMLLDMRGPGIPISGRAGTRSSG